MSKVKVKKLKSPKISAEDDTEFNENDTKEVFHSNCIHYGSFAVMSNLFRSKISSVSWGLTRSHQN